MDRQEPMSDEDYEDTINRINTLRVSELKALCRATGRLVSGRKADLAERLKLFFQLGRDNNDNVLLLATRTLVLKAANFQEVPNFDTIYNALKTNSHLFMLPSAGSNVVPAVQSSVTHNQLPMSTGNTNMFQGVNMFPTKPSEDSKKVRPWVYFQESPFYRLKRLVHGTPVMAEKAPGRRGQCNIQFILNESETKTLFGKPNYKLLLLSGSYDGRNVTNNAFVEFPQPLEIYCNKAPVKGNVKGIKNKPGTARPANLTPFVKEPPTMNNLQVVYAFSNTDYLFYLYIVESFSAFDVLQKVLAQPHIIKEATLNSFNKTEDDDDVVEMSQILSLKCPLSFSRMKYPCKSIYCEHVQCFDGLAFLQLQEQASTWSCPLCSKKIDVKDLALSDYVEEILKNTSDLVETVEIDPNGNWTIGKEDEPDVSQPQEKSTEGLKSEPTEEFLPPPDASVEVISLDSDSEDQDDGVAINPPEPEVLNSTVLPQDMLSTTVAVSNTTNNEGPSSSSASLPNGEEMLDYSDLPTANIRRGLPRIDSEGEDTASISSSPLPPPSRPPIQSLSGENRLNAAMSVASGTQAQSNDTLHNSELGDVAEKDVGTEDGNRRQRSISPLPPPAAPPPHLHSQSSNAQSANNTNSSITIEDSHAVKTASVTSQENPQGSLSVSFTPPDAHRSISDPQSAQLRQMFNSTPYNSELTTNYSSNLANRPSSFSSSGFPRNTEVVPPSNGNRRSEFNRTKSIQIFLQRQEQLLTHNPTLQQLEASLKLQDHIYNQIATQKKILEALNPSLRNEEGQYDQVIRQATVRTAQKNRILKLLAKKRGQLNHTHNHHANVNSISEKVDGTMPNGHGSTDFVQSLRSAPLQASQNFSPLASSAQQEQHSQSPNFNRSYLVPSASNSSGQVQNQDQYNFNFYGQPLVQTPNEVGAQTLPQLYPGAPSIHSSLRNDKQTQSQNISRNGVQPQLLNPAQESSETPSLVLPSWSNNSLLQSTGNPSASSPTNGYNNAEMHNDQDQNQQTQTKGLLGISMHTSIFDKTPLQDSNGSLKEPSTQKSTSSSSYARPAEGIAEVANKRSKTVVDLTLSDEENDGDH